jgi:hypothetical protein
VALLPLSLSGCHQSHSLGTADSFELSSSVPLKSYVKFAVGMNGHKDTHLYFPLLQIYDSEGRLVYVGHVAKENALVLEQTPDNISSLQHVPEAAPLGDVIKELPEFESRRGELVNSNRATVLSVFLEDCHACSIQEQTLDTTQKQLLRRGVNLLIIHVARPA